MFITKKHISRRAVLKAAGVTLGLPFLDAMVPAGTALAQTAAVPKLRTGFFYIPHGAIMGNTSHGPSLDKWTPSGSGAVEECELDWTIGVFARDRHLREFLDRKPLRLGGPRLHANPFAHVVAPVLDLVPMHMDGQHRRSIVAVVPAFVSPAAIAVTSSRRAIS